MTTIRMGLMLAPIDHPQCRKVRMVEKPVGRFGYKQPNCVLTPEFDQRGLGIPSDAVIKIVLPYPKGDALEFVIEHCDLPETLAMRQLPTVRPVWDGERFLGWEVLGK